MTSLKEELLRRQAQWARFHAWEERRRRDAAGSAGEDAVRAIGEILEFFLDVSGALPRRDIGEKIEGIARLRRALGAIPPRR